MKTTQNCLQEMVNAIKGVEPNEVAENKTTQTLLREIADAINNETTTDEGKNTQTLLGDITEAIRESGGGSGGETFEVEISISQESGSSTATYSSNKTFTEVMSAVDNGDTIQVNLTYTYGGSAVTTDVLLSGKITLSGQDTFTMLTLVSDGTNMAYVILMWMGNSENIIVENSNTRYFIIGAEST